MKDNLITFAAAPNYKDFKYRNAVRLRPIQYLASICWSLVHCAGVAGRAALKLLFGAASAQAAVREHCGAILEHLSRLPLREARRVAQPLNALEEERKRDMIILRSEGDHIDV